MIDRLSEILLSVGRKSDAASWLGSVNAKLAALNQVNTFSSWIEYSTYVIGVYMDTGQLPANDYEIVLFAAGYSTNVGIAEFQHRNAANSANVSKIRTFDPGIPQGRTPYIHIPRYTIAANERFRLEQTAAGASAPIMADAAIIIRPAK